jgi:hypothetical protein
LPVALYSPKCLEEEFSKGCMAPVQHLRAALTEIGCLGVSLEGVVWQFCSLLDTMTPCAMFCDVEGYPYDVGPFSVDGWFEIQSHLRTAEKVMADLASEHHMKFIGDIPVHGAEWPARRLWYRRLWEVRQIGLVLNWRYFEDKEVFYELNLERKIDVGGWYRKLLSRAMVAKYSPEQMLDEQLLRRDLDRLVERSKF